MPTSIFTDDTGRRRRRARRSVRVASATLLIGVAAMTLSLFTHVSLPSLGLPISLPGKSDTAVQKPKHTSTTPSPATTRSTPPSANSSAATPKNSAATPKNPVVVTPAATATATSHGKSSDAPRATPTHGARPATPPGKTK